jgi:Holliday junction DNA helicase RuvB
MIQEGFVQRTPRGRVATRRAFEHLKVPMPSGSRPLIPGLLDS